MIPLFFHSFQCSNPNIFQIKIKNQKNVFKFYYANWKSTFIHYQFPKWHNFLLKVFLCFSLKSHLINKMQRNIERKECGIFKLTSFLRSLFFFLLSLLCLFLALFLFLFFLYGMIMNWEGIGPIYRSVIRSVVYIEFVKRLRKLKVNVIHSFKYLSVCVFSLFTCHSR